jgi:hypothetical protein
LPSLDWQSRFAAGLFQEGCAVPSALDGNLWQEQTATAMPADEKAMTAHFNLFGLDRLRRRENAEVNFEVSSLFFGNGCEAVVLESRGPRGFRYRTVDRAGGQHVANASAQFSTQME